MGYAPVVPFANARVTAVTGPGFSADIGRAATAGPQRWVGDAEAFVGVRTETDDSGDQVDDRERGYLLVPASVLVQGGDTITFTHGAAAAETRRVRQVVALELVGAVRVDLEDD